MTDRRDDAGARLRRLIDPPALLADPIVQCIVLIVATSVVFLLFPGIDLWFSGLFYESGHGFPMARLDAFVGLRTFHRTLTWVVAVAIVLAVLIKVALPSRASIVRPRDALFILSTLAVGPGIVVNLIFKNHWGRPRPAMLGYFHGDQPFVGVWQITDYCATNCSFVSGEASSAIWLLTLVVLLPERWRPLGTKILLALAVLLSLNRIAFGGHFLSDVLLSWWLTLLVIAITYRFLYVSPAAALTNERLDDALARIGVVLRRMFSRRHS